MPFRLVLLVMISALFTMAAGVSAAAAPRAELWPHWTKHDPHSQLSIDHSAWTRFLQMYVRTDENGVNVMAYGDVSRASRKNLDDYIVKLEMAPIATYSRDEQLAYWINLYNALTVRVILAYYPVDSIMDIKISPGWFSPGPWGKKLIKVDNRPLSLDDIEHRILRPIWMDPRVHYAVNCASIGCPNLQKEAFTAANTQKLMDQGARAYINHPRGAEFVGGQLYVSTIYNWFIEDFGGTNRDVIAHLSRYAEPALKSRLDEISDIAGNRYDWGLNLYRKPE
ncbi:MAG: DUF547 domain-containing protein [Alphaproteobacteria bacterium]